MAHRKRDLFGWIIAAAAATVLGLGAAAVFCLHWPVGAVLWLVIWSMAVLGIPAGLKYGTQDKDYF